MAARPDADRTLGVRVARKALASGTWTCAIMLRDRGPAPFAAWDVLTVAVRQNDVPATHIVAERGGRCDTATWAAALRPRDDIVSFLCERFGTVGLQDAIDAVAGLAFGR